MNNTTFIQTTVGLSEIKDSDKILIHEHIFNRFPYWHQSQVEECVLRELKKTFEQGISIICDLTAYTKPYNYYRIIEESPVSIVSCLGFYTPRHVSSELKHKSADALIRSYSKIIEKGIGSKKIKPGILKVAAQSSELNSLESVFFHVVGQLSIEYNLPIAVHAPKGAYNHVQSLISAGVNPEKILVAHIESSITKEEEFEKRLQEATEILKLGSYIQLADFGCTPSSKKCIKGLSFAEEIIRSGYLEQLLLSGDSTWRWKNNEFVVKEFNHGNGKHYTYTQDFTLPMLKKIVPQFDLEHILLHSNPKKLFR